jgi:predicted transcriptional regulator
MTTDRTAFVSSMSVDDLFDAVANRHRRRLLTALLETGSLRIDEVTASVDDLETVRLRMSHVHLPKLADIGLIEWTHGMDEIERGPQFEQVRWLLQSLRSQANELPHGW